MFIVVWMVWNVISAHIIIYVKRKILKEIKKKIEKSEEIEREKRGMFLLWPFKNCDLYAMNNCTELNFNLTVKRKKK